MTHRSLSNKSGELERQAAHPFLNRSFFVFVGLLVFLLVAGFCTRHVLADEERTITFAGRQWIVKSGFVGPGPNHWSDDPESVWVDDAGALHLKIRQIDGVWHSAEVYLPGCATYGSYQFTVQGRIDELDPNTVAAAFLYQDDDTEIDIEFSRWGNEGAAENGQYVVQPYFHEGNRHQFAFDLRENESTHTVTWRPGLIEWRSLHGRQTAFQNAANLIQHWTYGGSDIPATTACMHVHINHWLLQGLAPANGQPSELVITDVRLPQMFFLPQIRGAPNPIPISTPSVTVSAEGARMWGTVSPEQYCNDGFKIAAYAKTDLWYVQPYADERRNIRINSDCTWASSTHTWHQAAAFLVTADFDSPTTIRRGNCPPLPLNPEADPRILAGACFP